MCRLPSIGEVGPSVAARRVGLGHRIKARGDGVALRSIRGPVRGQYYTSGSLSFLAEWIMSVESVAYPYDGASFGIELETRGHFFKIVLTNQVRMKPTQF